LVQGRRRNREDQGADGNGDGNGDEEGSKPRHLGELLETSVKPVRIKNLQILTSGDAWVNPNVTISNYAPRLKAVLHELKKTYDTILIDAPPLMLVHDAAVVSTLVDGVVFVVNSARVDEESLQKAKQLLDNAKANVLGIVLNHFEPVGVYGSYYSYYRETATTAEAASA
jgi:capsular exopolysaccharide synthesis family protein